MRKAILAILLLFNITSAVAQEAPVLSPEDMSAIVSYTRPVSLAVTLTGPLPSHELGSLLKSWHYDNRAETLHSFSVSIFKGGTLWRNNRARLEDHITRVAQERPGQDDIGVHVTPDGRRIYFSVIGFGPGGAAMGAFSTLPGGQFDLLVVETVDFEDDLEQGRKLKDPARPTRTLREVYAGIEPRVTELVTEIP